MAAALVGRVAAPGTAGWAAPAVGLHAALSRRTRKRERRERIERFGIPYSREALKLELAAVQPLRGRGCGEILPIISGFWKAFNGERRNMTY